MPLTSESKKRFAKNTLENVLNAINNAGIFGLNNTYIFRGKGTYIELRTFPIPGYMKFTLCVYRPENSNLEPFFMESNIYPKCILN